MQSSVQRLQGISAPPGWSKKRVKDTLASIQRDEVLNWIEREESAGRKVSATAEPVSGAARTSEDISLIVGGGRAGAFCAFVPLVEVQSGGKVIIKRIGGRNA